MLSSWVCVPINFVINVHVTIAIEVPVLKEISIAHVENSALIETPGFMWLFFVLVIIYYSKQEHFHTVIVK